VSSIDAAEMISLSMSPFFPTSFANQKLSSEDIVPSNDSNDKLEEENVSQLLHKVTASQTTAFF
jgi:hypothetical protein